MSTRDDLTDGLDIQGCHPAIRQVIHIARRVAATDSTVLVTGESGTGKELVARHIHTYSPRAIQPFVAVNCGAIPPDLLESEMFGHAKGAFTGAVATRMGIFQMANGGTIFLDEIGDMQPHLQVKLLRVLQEREVRPIGTDHCIRIDVRVIAATKVNLATLVNNGRFREDLFYRLQVIPIVMPSLRERQSDIPLLVRHFVSRHNAHRSVQVEPDAMEHLWHYGWPGNVRELENLIERLVVLSEDGVIRAESLPSDIRACHFQQRAMRSTLTDEGFVLPRAVEAFEHSLIIEALRRTNGNKSAAARLLGVKRPTLVAKLTRSALIVPPEPTPPRRSEVMAA